MLFRDVKSYTGGREIVFLTPSNIKIPGPLMLARGRRLMGSPNVFGMLWPWDGKYLSVV